MKTKRFLAALAATVATMSLCAVGTGAEAQVQTVLYHAIDGVEIPMTRGVTPRFKYFDNMSCAMSQPKSGISTCTGSATVNTAYDNTITVTAQRKQNGAWVNKKDRSSSESQTFLVVEYQYALTAGYDYRAVTSIVVDTGSHTETATCASSTIYY